MGKRQIAAVLLPVLLAACDDNTAVITITAPNQVVTVKCSNIIDFQGKQAHITGLDIPLQILQDAGVNEVKLGAASLDPVTLRQASELIEALDNSQLMFCKGLLLVAPEDRYKVLQDYDTQVIALTTLLRNLSIATTKQDAQAAVAVAAATAATSTAAKGSPPTPAKAPNASSATVGISHAATNVASAAAAVVPPGKTASLNHAGP